VKRVSILLVALFALSSCSKHCEIFPSEVKEKKLYLLAINGQSIPKESQAYIILHDNSFEAFSGCNNFYGTFELDEEQIHFKIKDIDTNVCRYIPLQHVFLESLVHSSRIVTHNNIVSFKEKGRSLLLFKK